MSQLHLFNPQHDYWRDRLDAALLDCWQVRNWAGTSGAAGAGSAVEFFAQLLFDAHQMPVARYERLTQFRLAYERHLQAVDRLDQAGRWRVIKPEAA